MFTLRIFLLLIAVIIPLKLQSQEFLEHRESKTLDTWKFYKGDTSYAYNTDELDDSKWEMVKVPHTWNATDVLTKGTDCYQGIGWYRTHIEIKKQEGKRYFLRFSGVSLISDVFINGEHIGQHKGGYSAFTYEVTPYIHNGSDNLVAVRVDNSAHYDVAPTGAYYYPIFGGIYRPVTLFCTPETNIATDIFGSSGVFIHPGNVSKEKADFTVKTCVQQTLIPKKHTTGPELQTESGKPGLTAKYYTNGKRTGTPAIVRNEKQAFFDIGHGSVDEALPKDNFSASWEGNFVPEKSGIYTFYSTSDDGSWVYLNNELFIDNGGLHGPIEKSKSIKLIAGKSYPIRIDYTEAVLGAYMKFQWTYLSDQTMDENFSLKTEIMDDKGHVIAQENTPFVIPTNSNQEVQQHFQINNPHLWNAKADPYLYTLRVNLFDKSKNKVVDTIDQPLGLRSYYVDKEKGLILNEESYNLYGVCRHQECEGYGSALSPKQHQKDFELIQEVGANGIRLAHYQQADIMYSMADKAGLVVWAEIPNTPQYKDTPAYMENCAQQLKELILQNYNHPSIFFWGLYNEVGISAKNLNYLNSIAKDLDPRRLTTQADFSEVEKRHSITDVAAWNWYFGWYGSQTEKYKTWFDGLHENAPNIKGGLSEYGAGGCVTQQQEPPVRPEPDSNFFPEQYQTQYHENVWSILKDRDDVWCKFIWNMFDFSWTTVDRGDRPNINHKGLVTHDRKTKKDSFYFYKVNWSKEPVVHINSKRLVERTSDNISVNAYANTETLALYLNGKLISEKENTSDINKFTWENIKLLPGRNQVSIIGKNNNDIYSDSSVWTYTPPQEN